MSLRENFDQKTFSFISFKLFVPVAIFFSLAGDLSYFVFIKFALATKENLLNWLKDYSWLPNMNLILSNQEMLDKLYQDFQRNINILIGIVIIMNLFSYISFYKKRPKAVKYLKNLSLIGLVLGFFTIWEAWNYGTFWVVIMFLTIPLYWIVYRGIKYYKDEFQN